MRVNERSSSKSQPPGRPTLASWNILVLNRMDKRPQKPKTKVEVVTIDISGRGRQSSTSIASPSKAPTGNNQSYWKDQPSLRDLLGQNKKPVVVVEPKKRFRQAKLTSGVIVSNCPELLLDKEKAGGISSSVHVPQEEEKRLVIPGARKGGPVNSVPMLPRLSSGCNRPLPTS